MRVQRKVELDADKLRMWMKHRRLTAKELSLAMGASPAYISNVLNTSGRMSATAYKAKCAAFEVPEDTFTKPQPPEVFTETLEAAPDAEIMKRLETIEQKLDELLKIWR